MLPNPYLPTMAATGARLRLGCLPYAGGGSAVFHRWRAILPRSIEVVPICLPGRESRIDERPHIEMKALVSEIADSLVPHLDCTYALLGHSMGAWIAFELVRELRRRELSLPQLLVVAASPPPHLLRKGKPLHERPDEEFVAQVADRFGGIPQALRDNAELLQLVLPALRADFQLLEEYQFMDEPPLDVDIVALGGTNDPTVSASELANWRQHTAAKFSVRLVPGDHFFPFAAPDSTGEASGATSAVRLIGQQLERSISN